jgi:hypothetical protein
VFLKTITALCATAILAIPTAASANLGAAGPVDPASVPFPTFYDDGAGTSLALCVNDPLCPASPPVFTNEAPNDEAFYMLAGAEATGPQGQSIGMEFAIEAAWLDPETPITFGRIQATLQGLEPNSTYTVEHPWGVSHFTTESDGTLVGGKRAAQREETDGTFTDTLNTPIGPFIRNVDAPAGYLGNGLTAGPVTGSLIRNSIRVTGPGLPQEVLSEPDPITGEQTILQAAGITTDQFTVEGKLFDPTAPLPPVFVPKEPDTDGDGVTDNVDRCINQPGPASNAGCPPPVIVTQPPPPPIVIEKPPVIIEKHIVTVQQVLVPAAPAPVVQPVPALIAPRHVSGLRIRHGVLNATAPANAVQVRIVVRKGNRVVKRVKLSVPAGRVVSLRLAKRPGRYHVTVQAVNVDGTRVAFGPVTSRSFRIR